MNLPSRLDRLEDQRGRDEIADAFDRAEERATFEFAAVIAAQTTAARFKRAAGSQPGH